MKRQMPDDDYYMSLQEIADELGVTRQVVWAIEKRAIAKIRNKLREWSDGEECIGDTASCDEPFVSAGGDDWGLRGLEAKGRELLRDAPAIPQVEWGEWLA